MVCHVQRQAQQAEAFLANANTKFVVFSRNHLLIEPTRGLRSLAPDRHISAAGFNRASRGVPFQIADSIVNTGVWIQCGPPSSDNTQMRVLVQSCDRRGNSFRVQSAISIQKLHELQIWKA